MGNILHSETREPIEYNSPDFTTSHYVTVGNILSTGASAVTGLCFGLAAVDYWVFADSIIKVASEEAIHVEDEQLGGIVSAISAKTAKDGFFMQPPIPPQGAADPVITQGMHITHTGTQTGFFGYLMGFTGDPYVPALGSNHVMKGFDAGYFLSGTDGYSLMDNSIAKDCNIGIFVKSKHTHIGTIHCEDCPTLAKGGVSSRIGKVISNITPTTILDLDGTGFPGSYMAGFLFPKEITHTGGGLEAFSLFAMEDLTHAKSAT